VFYAVYGGLVDLAAALELTPGTPLGLLTNAVQALAGVAECESVPLALMQ
jgi:hypothetical protein